MEGWKKQGGGWESFFYLVCVVDSLLVDWFVCLFVCLFACLFVCLFVR